MDLNTNGAKAIAVMVALNAGLLFSHHLPIARMQRPVVRAAIVNSGEICKTKLEAQKAAFEARKAALEARSQARQAAREIVKARQQMQKDAMHAALMAPSSGMAKTHSSVTDYVHCLLNTGTRSINGGS